MNGDDPLKDSINIFLEINLYKNENALALIVLESLLQAEANFLLQQKSDQRKLFMMRTKIAYGKKACNGKQD